MDLNTILIALVAVLVAGNVFAWFEFVLVAKRHVGCKDPKCKGPLASRCFIGALFFSASLILAAAALSLV